MRPARPRRHVSSVYLTLLRPIFRYSVSRDSYVLRVIGNTRGPVLRPAPQPSPVRQ